MLKRKNSNGMTLIELMLALTLSTFILSFLYEIYLAAENNRRMQHNLMTIQENTQLISQLIAQHVRMSGYAGCAKLTKDFPIKNNVLTDFSEKTKIQRYDKNDSKPGT